MLELVHVLLNNSIQNKFYRMEIISRAKICENKNIKNYLDANRSFAMMIEQVNTIIGYFVKGGESSGCSGNCSSCGGCH